MTLTLILIRHAKSCWRNPVLTDHDRPLNKRGIRNARAVGRWLAQNRHIPDACLCSTAKRAQATFKWVSCDLPPLDAIPQPQLYHATAVDILATLRTATSPTVMMVGHNPGMLFAAHGLVRQWPDHPAFETYPTGATCVIRFDETRWGDVEWKTGTVADFVVPRELVQDPPPCCADSSIRNEQE